jgi:hypothetical protein
MRDAGRAGLNAAPMATIDRRIATDESGPEVARYLGRDSPQTTGGQSVCSAVIGSTFIARRAGR